MKHSCFLASLLALIWAVNAVGQSPTNSVNRAGTWVNLNEMSSAAVSMTSLKELLHEVPAVSVSVLVGSKLKDLIDSERIRTRVELVLRRNRVPVVDDAHHSFGITISGTTGDKIDFVSMTVRWELSEVALVPRPTQWLKVYVPTWAASYSFLLMKLEGEEQKRALEVAERHAEDFANAYLSSKQQPPSRK